MQYDVFITHNTKDQKWAEVICENLESNGFKCFLGYRDIPVGQVLSTASLKALVESRMLLVVYTKNYNTTPQMNREVEAATKNDIPVLTVGQDSDAEFVAEVGRYLGWVKRLIAQDGFESAIYNKEEGQPVAQIVASEATDDDDDCMVETCSPSYEEAELEETSYGYSSYMPQVADVTSRLSYEVEEQEDEVEETVPVVETVAETVTTDWEKPENAVSCYMKAEAYYHGEGVRQSYFEAVKWYMKAAEMGHADAQCDLGNCYYYGEGLPENYERSVYWYEKAAEQGNVRALYNLGNSYYYGEGVARDEKLAIAYYDRAASLGNVQAEERLEELGVRR